MTILHMSGCLHTRFLLELPEGCTEKPLRAASNVQVAQLDLSNVVAVAFSPKSTYLTTFQRPQPSAGNTEKNLKVLSPPAEMPPRQCGGLLAHSRDLRWVAAASLA